MSVQAQIIPFQRAPEATPRELRLPRGRLVELSGVGAVARMTLATHAIVEAQAEGDPCAWVQRRDGPLFPPDLARGGVDLRALVVTHIPAQAGAPGLLKAAELLLRSGGFGLVVVDLRHTKPSQNVAWQGRLLGIAREHKNSVLLLTDSRSDIGSLGSLISLRIEPAFVREQRGVFRIEPHVLKDKLGDFTGMASLSRHGPPGFW